MEIIKDSEKRTKQPASSVVVYEYDMQDPTISGAVAEIKGRYPEKGYVANTALKELVYILSGSGALHLRDQSDRPVGPGDTILIDRNEAFAWSGEMRLFIATTPRFDPAQYIAID